MPNALKELAKAGVSVWLDDLSRPLIETGGFAKMVDNGEVVGVTTNPHIREGDRLRIRLRGSAQGTGAARHGHP